MLTRLDVIRQIRQHRLVVSHHVGSTLVPAPPCAPYIHRFSVALLLLPSMRIFADIHTNCGNKTFTLKLSPRQLLSYIKTNYSRTERI